MSTKNILIIIITVVALGLSIGWYWLITYKPNITSFEECTEAGFPILESYPARCQTSDGKEFIQPINNENSDYRDKIKINNLNPDQIITSPITITGEARGTWFFEASFPVVLKDSQGQVLGTFVATALDEWMTENFVPFTVDLIFQTTSATGTIIFQKDNPSGLPENDDSLIIPINFK